MRDSGKQFGLALVISTGLHVALFGATVLLPGWIWLRPPMWPAEGLAAVLVIGSPVPDPAPANPEPPTPPASVPVDPQPEMVEVSESVIAPVLTPAQAGPASGTVPRIDNPEPHPIESAEPVAPASEPPSIPQPTPAIFNAQPLPAAPPAPVALDTTFRAEEASPEPGNQSQPPSIRPAALRSGSAPQYRRNPKPIYPLAARRLRQEGLVLLRVSVDETGHSAKVHVQTSSGYPLLDEAAVRAVRRWEFVPSQAEGSAMAAEVEVPVLFKLAEP